jgi:hypothetical protein
MRMMVKMFHSCCFQTLARVVQGRWFVIAVGIVVMVASAGAYSFGVYSQKLKTVLNINQETLNIIANFKDLGVNLGVHSGLLFDYWSPGAVLFLGAVQTVVGYLCAWLSVTRRIQPTVWEMCLFLFIGANSQPMLNTAVLVQTVKLFPNSKGIVIGLMKGYIGISGAILIQIYITLEGSTKPESFLMLLIWFPAAVALISILFIRPLPPFQGAPDVKYFYWFLGLGFVLAAYLMGVSITQNLTNVSVDSERVLGVVLLILLAVPLFAIAYRSEMHGKMSLDETLTSGGAAPGLADIETGSQKPPSTQVTTLDSLRTTSKNTSKDENDNDDGDEFPIPKDNGTSEREENGFADKNIVLAEVNNAQLTLPGTAEVVKKKPWPRRGEDHTIWQAYRSLDFWLLFVAVIFGIGSGLAATDNMGQLGLSLGYTATNVRTFVSLLSIWNSIGRWMGGFLSEILLQRYGTSRTKFFTIMLLVMATAYLLIAINVPGCLYFGSILLGLSFGTQYPIYATVVAEEFGLRYFGTLYNSIGVACIVGNYMLSVPVAGRFYDSEAKRQAKEGALISTGKKSLLCHGASCYRRTFFTFMSVTLGAAIVGAVLWYRTRAFYKDVHQRYQQSKKTAAQESTEGVVE